MSKFYINYSDGNFKEKQNFALKMAKLFGKFDQTIGFDRSDIDSAFYEENKHILEQSRGGGYWLWKPYFIFETLKKIEFGDYLFYSDSGAFFLKNIDSLISELDSVNQDIVAFELPLIERQWTKKELLISMDCESERYVNTNQVMATFQLIKKSDLSLEFYKKYLEYSKHEINITDKFDSAKTQNADFIEHRHDQSIFSLLYKKYNLRPFRDPTQRAEFPSTYALSNDYHLPPNKLHTMQGGILFRYYEYPESYSHVLYINRKQPPFKSLLRYFIKVILFKLNLYKDIIA